MIKRSIPELRTFIEDIFPGHLYFIENIMWVGFICNQKAKAEQDPLREQISATQGFYVLILKYYLSPEMVRKPTHPWSCGAECFQQDVALTTGMAVSWSSPKGV